MRGRSARDTVMADAALLAERLRATDVRLGALRKEYECGHGAMKEALLTQMTVEEYRALAAKRLSAPNSGCFRKGHIPWDKGLSFPGSRATQFKPGHLRGMAARNWRPVGTIEIRPDRPPMSRRHRKNARPGRPRRWIKVREHRPGDRGWTHYARYVWEQAHGPIPPEMVIIHEDGDALNDDLENLRLGTRADNLRHLRATRPDVEERRKLRLAKSLQKKRIASRQLKARLGPVVTVWDCPGCGERFQKEPERCAKCGMISFDLIRGPKAELLGGLRVCMREGLFDEPN